MYSSIPDYMDIKALLSFPVKHALMYDERLYIYLYIDTKYKTFKPKLYKCKLLTYI